MAQAARAALVEIVVEEASHAVNARARQARDSVRSGFGVASIPETLAMLQCTASTKPTTLAMDSRLPLR
jgi:hypothetical protein